MIFLHQEYQIILIIFIANWTSELDSFENLAISLNFLCRLEKVVHLNYETFLISCISFRLCLYWQNMSLFFYFFILDSIFYYVWVSSFIFYNFCRMNYNVVYIMIICMLACIFYSFPFCLVPYLNPKIGHILLKYFVLILFLGALMRGFYFCILFLTLLFRIFYWNSCNFYA